jgi:hypothetical protein
MGRVCLLGKGEFELLLLGFLPVFTRAFPFAGVSFFINHLFMDNQLLESLPGEFF